MGALPLTKVMDKTCDTPAAPGITRGIAVFWFLVSNEQEEHRIFFPTYLV